VKKTSALASVFSLAGGAAIELLVGSCRNRGVLQQLEDKMREGTYCAGGERKMSMWVPQNIGEWAKSWIVGEIGS